jgi:hypothetical protein
VLPRYKRRDTSIPAGTLDLYVQALQHELPGANEDDALAFLRNPKTTMTRVEARKRAEKELSTYKPVAGRERSRRPRLFAPLCDSQTWTEQGDASPWFDTHTGAPVDIVVSPGAYDPYEIRVRIADFANLAAAHIEHPESKSACVDDSPCDHLNLTYRGPLMRRSVKVDGADIVGKESQHFEDGVAIALGELVEDADGDLRGVFRSHNATGPTRTLLEGLSSRAVARDACTTDAMVNAVRTDRAPASSPAVNRIRRAAQALSASPPRRAAILALGRKRRRAESDRVTDETLAALRAAEAPYWAALDRAGDAIVPDMQNVFGTWRASNEFDGLAPRLLRCEIPARSKREASRASRLVPGNLDAIVADLCAHGLPSTRGTVLAWFRTHPRPVSRAAARREATAIVTTTWAQRLDEAFGVAS